MKKLTIILTLVIIFAVGVTFFGCTDKTDDTLTDRENAIYQLVLDVSYKFKNPSSVRIVSGKVNYDTTNTKNPPYEFRDFELEKGYYINANLRLSATNGYGATTTEYYHIIYNKDGKISTDDINETMRKFMDIMEKNPYLKPTMLPALQAAVDWYDECEILDDFNIDKINKFINKKWNK